MARYWARLNSANVVENVAKIEGFDGKSDAECLKYLKSIYRTENFKEGFKTDVNNPRGSFPSIGMEYYSEHNIFIVPKPYPSWILTEDKLGWKAPVNYPITYNWTNTAENKTAEDIALAEQKYVWNESTTSWDPA